MGIKLRDVIIIRLAIAMIYTTYSTPIPFLPIMAENHNLRNWHIGLILSSYAAGGILPYNNISSLTMIKRIFKSTNYGEIHEIY